MELYLNQLKNIENDVFYNMPIVSQKTIDLIEDVIDSLSKEGEYVLVGMDDLGAISYDINILLEIWNPELEYDIEILNRINEVVKKWGDDINPFDENLLEKE